MVPNHFNVKLFSLFKCTESHSQVSYSLKLITCYWWQSTRIRVHHDGNEGPVYYLEKRRSHRELSYYFLVKYVCVPGEQI